MSLFPARDQLEAQQKRDAIELCGKNRGPHDYIPIAWVVDHGAERSVERVTRLLCRVCFSTVAMATLLENYPDVSYVKSDNNLQQ